MEDGDLRTLEMKDGYLRSGNCDGVTEIDLEDGSMDVSAEDAGGISTLMG